MITDSRKWVRRWAGVATVALLAAAWPASAAEHTLAGVAIFSRATSVLQKYGNPSEVRSGATGPIAGGASASGGGGGGASTGAGPAMGSPFGGAPPEFGGGMGSPMGSGAMGSPFGGSPAAGGSSAGGTTSATNGDITWVYDLPNTSFYEFTISADGRVIQIRAAGLRAPVRSARGVTLGQKYGEVIKKYGYPESHFIQNGILTASYNEDEHVTFEFYRQRVVGITVAAAE